MSEILRSLPKVQSPKLRHTADAFGLITTPTTSLSLTFFSDVGKGKLNYD